MTQSHFGERARTHTHTHTQSEITVARLCHGCGHNQRQLISSWIFHFPFVVQSRKCLPSPLEPLPL